MRKRELLTVRRPGAGQNMSPEVIRMKTALLRALLPFAVLALAAGAADAQKLYKWVDKDGQVHYGDKIPPEYADQDREVLNKQGMAVGREEGAESPAEAQARAQREKEAKAALDRAQRDRMLVASYQNVGDIERVRGQRLDQLDSQIAIQEQSLSQLKARYAEQLKRAGRYQPASKDPKAPAMPEGLADDISRSESDIKTQQVNLDKRRKERAALNAQFDADVARYKELKGIK